jgi:hypothetical protein
VTVFLHHHPGLDLALLVLSSVRCRRQSGSAGFERSNVKGWVRASDLFRVSQRLAARIALAERGLRPGAFPPGRSRSNRLVSGLVSTPSMTSMEGRGQVDERSVGANALRIAHQIKVFTPTVQNGSVSG